MYNITRCLNPLHNVACFSKTTLFEFIYQAISTKTELINSSSLGIPNAKDKVVSTTFPPSGRAGGWQRTPLLGERHSIIIKFPETCCPLTLFPRSTYFVQISQCSRKVEPDLTIKFTTHGIQIWFLGSVRP